jgi:hypothetical protein
MPNLTYDFSVFVPVKRVWPICAFMIFLGVCFCALSGGLAYSRHDFLTRAIETPGQVMRLERRDGYYNPVVTYTDHTGVARELYTDQGTTTPMYFEGERVIVLYDPTDPEFPVHAMIKKFWELWLAPIAFGFMGTIFVVLSTIFWFLSTRTRRVHKDSHPQSS